MTHYDIKPTSTYAQLVKAGWTVKPPNDTVAIVQAAKVLTLLRRHYVLTTPDGIWTLGKSALPNRIVLYKGEAFVSNEYPLTAAGLVAAIERLNLPF